MSNDPDANKELTTKKMADPVNPPRSQRIAETLNALFAPAALEVVDESAKHKGHAGARPEGETHFRVTMTSAALAGKSRVERQRMVNAALKREFEAGLHALALNLRAPGEH